MISPTIVVDSSEFSSAATRLIRWVAWARFFLPVAASGTTRASPDPDVHRDRDLPMPPEWLSGQILLRYWLDRHLAPAIIEVDYAACVAYFFRKN